ncbi:MAG: AsmA family protein [Proteobacteria bacterium]|nr:AsmA family protein [Pseudomonadota bacterium]
MKAVRILLYTAGGVLLLAVLGAIAAGVFVDGAFVKQRAERLMQDEHQRTLSIEGTPKLTLFPVAGIELGKVRLSEKASDKEFLSLESARVAVRVMPLLAGAIEVEALSVAGFRLNLVRAKDGRMNSDDLSGKAGGAGPGESQAEGRHRRPSVRIAAIDIERVNVSFRDEATGRTAMLADMNLKTGRLADAEPSPVSFSAHVKGSNPLLDVRASLAGRLGVNLAKETFEVAGLAFQAKGTVDKDALSATLSAPQVSITPAKASGSAVNGELAMKGPRRNVDAKLRIAGLEGSGSAFSIASIILDIDAAAEGNSVRGRIETPVSASLSDRTWALPKFVANLTFAGPAIPQKSVTLPISAEFKANLAKQSASADVKTKFDESSIHAKFAASKLAPLHATFDLDVDKLNLDRYIAPKPAGETRPEARIDLAGLKGPALSGKVQVGALKANGASVGNVKAEIKLAGGKLDVSPYSADLYGGRLAGSLSVDANSYRFETKDTVTGVTLGPLLRDVAKKDVLDGRGNLKLDVSATGTTVTALKKALAGSARLEVKDGAIKGINLAESVRNFKANLGSKSSQAAGDSTKQTDFTEMSASFSIRNGIAHNDDLKAASPFLRLSGAGNIDIGNSTLDYTAKATLAATGKGQGGAANVAGITVPVKLSGTFDRPSWHIDFSGVLGSLGGAVGGAAGTVTDTLKSATGGVKDKLKGLFGK